MNLSLPMLTPVRIGYGNGYSNPPMLAPYSGNAYAPMSMGGNTPAYHVQPIAQHYNRLASMMYGHGMASNGMNNRLMGMGAERF